MKQVLGFIAAMAMTVALSSSAPVEEAAEVREFCSLGAACNDDNTRCITVYECGDDLEDWKRKIANITAAIHG